MLGMSSLAKLSSAAFSRLYASPCLIASNICSRRTFFDDADSGGFDNQGGPPSQFGRPRAKCMNKVLLLGRIANDPGQGQSGVVFFNVHTWEHARRADGSNNDIMNTHRIVVFRPNDQEYVLNMARRGDRVYLTGSIMAGRRGPDGTELRAAIRYEDLIFLSRNNDVQRGTPPFRQFGGRGQTGSGGGWASPAGSPVGGDEDFVHTRGGPGGARAAVGEEDFFNDAPGAETEMYGDHSEGGYDDSVTQRNPQEEGDYLTSDSATVKGF